MNTHALAITASVFLTACEGPLEPAWLRPLSVEAHEDTLRLENRSDRPIFYFIHERQAAALILWAQCIEGPGCRSLSGGSRVTVPYTTIGGYEPGRREVIVWWWRAVPGSGEGLVPGPVQGLVVQL